jgi:choline dehydrogenase-like flavoprotein
MGMAPLSIHQGKRLTSATAYLTNAPPNLTIISSTLVANIIFEGKKAVGVKSTSGISYHARKEVIISGGSINTPQLLLLSGVGPKAELEKHDIPIVHDLPMVGQNLQDHCFSSIGIAIQKDVGTDELQSPSPMGWSKLPAVLTSPEFKALPTETKDFLTKPTTPHYEICSVRSLISPPNNAHFLTNQPQHTPSDFLLYTPGPSASFMGAISLVMNPQSRGTVTLRSSNPADAPVIDPKFLDHPFDQRVMIEGLRETMRLLSTPVYAPKTIEWVGPNLDSDEGAILVSTISLSRIL